MAYGAITIDTSIFDQKGLNLESGLLKQLEQFKGMPSPLILSEIIVRELHAHVTKKASEARAQTAKSLRISNTHLVLDSKKIEEAEKLLIPSETDSEISKTRIGYFINNTGAEIISASGHVELEDLIKKYFNSEPPFSESGKKKSEFPDAIALMSLEAWAKEKDIKVLAVSDDKDWEEFGAKSAHIDVVKDLADAIAVFQPQNEAVKYCNTLSSTLPNDEPKELYSFIQQYVSDSVEDIIADPEAWSQFYWEADDIVELKFEDFGFIVDDSNQALLQPVQVQETLIVIEAKIYVQATASCSFSLSVHDSIDKDYVPMGSTSAFTSWEFEAEVLITLEGDFKEHPEDVELTDFELVSYPTTVEFGDLEPDWWSDGED